MPIGRVIVDWLNCRRADTCKIKAVMITPIWTSKFEKKTSKNIEIIQHVSCAGFQLIIFTYLFAEAGIQHFIWTVFGLLYST